MGIKEAETLTDARKIVMFNSEAIHYIKNSLLKMTPSILKKLKDDHEKFTIIIRTKYPNVRIDLILANGVNNNNHDLMKLDTDLIYETMMEVPDESRD